jgi:hypothetical protein
MSQNPPYKYSHIIDNNLQGQAKAGQFPWAEKAQPRFFNPWLFTDTFHALISFSPGNAEADNWSCLSSSPPLLYHGLGNALVIEATMTQQIR